MEGFNQPQIKTPEGEMGFESRNEKLNRAQKSVAEMFKIKWQEKEL